LGDQIQDDELRGAFGTYMDEEKCIDVLGETGTRNTWQRNKEKVKRYVNEKG
jgi:hypothetical protein